MELRGLARRLPLAGAAVAGAVVGHGLAYALAVPEPGRRLALLAGSGHAYWSAAIAAAIVLGLVSLGCHPSPPLPGRPPHTGTARPASRWDAWPSAWRCSRSPSTWSRS